MTAFWKKSFSVKIFMYSLSQLPMKIGTSTFHHKHTWTCSHFSLNETFRSLVWMVQGPVQGGSGLILCLYHFHELFEQISFELSLLIGLD